MYSALLVAPLTDAPRVAASGFPDDTTALDVGGLDSAAFMSLHARALCIAWEPLLPAYDPVASASERGPWVFGIPEQLRDHLARLDEQGVRELAEHWSQCEELQDDGVSDTEAHEFLSGAAALARKAGASRESLLLWLSL
jgi:hypothetical protein